MLYSSIAILAILVTAITNHDVLFRQNEKDDIPAQKGFRRFLMSTMAFYVADALWGILDAADLNLALYIDTAIYFAVMAGAVLLWTQYAIAYLEESNRFSDFLLYAGQIFFAFQIVVIIINFFSPVLFWLDADGLYQAGKLRHLALILQAALFLMASGHTFYVALNTKGAVRRRYYTVVFFGIAMVMCIALQFFYPLLPIYSMGYMLGSCVLHAFVVEGVKDEYRRELEEALQRERQQRQELGSARRLAYTDSLTGVKSKHAYVEKAEELDEQIADNEIEYFGVVVFDLNGLKLINDTRGHEIGDEYIVMACRMICGSFKHSPVYRIGGDEFVAILDGDDYKNRKSILEDFDQRIEKNVRSDKVVVATGMAEYDRSRDYSFRTVFERADEAMYERKRNLKVIGMRV